MQNKAPSWVKVSLIGLLSLLLIVTAAPLTAAAQTPAPTPTPSAIPVEKIEIYFYWSNTCPHCLEAKPFLEELASRDPRIQLYQYEIHEGQNSDLYKQKALEYGFTPEYVPGIFIGEKYWVGFDESIRSQIEAHICQQIDCEAPQPVNGEIIDIPIIGKVDLTGKSLLLSTILIGFVDGVNPCSIWVLTMLLSLTLHTGSRRKVLIIGLVFLSVTALVYALFIAGLFSVLTFVSFVGWIQVVVALVALFFAIINIKDYFWYKEGISFTIADDKKPGIFQRMRKVLDASRSFWGLLGATVVLAGGVSLVEFSCTAGFPVLWTNILSAQKVDAVTFLLLLLVYMVIYQLDELVIFFVAVFTLRASKLEEKHGRILKLIGGILMLTLALVMILNPNLLNSLSSSLVIFAIAFVAVVFVLVMHRKVLPAFGIWIGSEERGEKSNKKKSRARH